MFLKTPYYTWHFDKINQVIKRQNLHINMQSPGGFIWHTFPPQTPLSQPFTDQSTSFTHECPTGNCQL